MAKMKTKLVMAVVTAAFFYTGVFSWGQLQLPGKYFLDTHVHVYNQEGEEVIEVKRADEILFWTDVEVRVTADLNGGGEVVRQTSLPILLQRTRLYETTGLALFVQDQEFHGIERVTIEPIGDQMGTVRMATTDLDGERLMKVMDGTRKIIVEYPEMIFDDSERVSRKQEKALFEKTELTPVREENEIGQTPAILKKSAPKAKVPKTFVPVEEVVEPFAPPLIETAMPDPCADGGTTRTSLQAGFSGGSGVTRLSMQASALVGGLGASRLTGSEDPCGGRTGTTRIEVASEEPSYPPSMNVFPGDDEEITRTSLQAAPAESEGVTRLTLQAAPASEQGGFVSRTSLVRRGAFADELLSNKQISLSVLGAEVELGMTRGLTRLARIQEGTSIVATRRELRSLISQTRFAPDGTSRDMIRDIVRNRPSIQRQVIESVAVQRVDLPRVRDAVRVERPRIRESIPTSPVEPPADTIVRDTFNVQRIDLPSLSAGPALSEDHRALRTRGQAVEPSGQFSMEASRSQVISDSQATR